MKNCRLDIKNAIIKTAVDLHAQDKYSYILKEDGTVYISNIKENNKTKAISRNKAINVAYDLQNKINWDPTLNQHIKAFVRDFDKYGPVYLEFLVSKEYIEHEFNKLPEDQKNEVKVDLKKEEQFFSKKESTSVLGNVRDLDYFRGDEALLQQELAEEMELKLASFNKELANKMETILKAKYPGIQLNITNTPVWEKGNNVLNQEEFENQVNYRLKASQLILDNLSKIKQWESNKSINQETLFKKIGELGIPKQQLELLKESKGETIEEKLASFNSNYSYAIEINTAKETSDNFNAPEPFQMKSTDYPDSTWFVDTNTGVVDFETKQEALDYVSRNRKITEKPTDYYSNLTVPGGTNYTENEIATPAITPSIKGHAQFATDKGIGWFRSDEQLSEPSNKIEPANASLQRGRYIIYDQETGEPLREEFAIELGKGSKIRRILEVQSDLFQKGRDKKDLVTTTRMQGVSQAYSNLSSFTIDGILYYSGMGIAMSEPEDGSGNSKKISNKEYDEAKAKWINQNSKQDTTENQFLQLLNKDNNWVNFFIKSIIQDSAKKGYEKVLFPSGDTVGKIEGFDKVEEKIKEFNDKLEKIPKANTIQELKDIVTSVGKSGGNLQTEKEWHIKKTKEELNHYLLAQKDTLSTIKFYEETVANVLKKQGYSPKQVTDEYGNTWYEVSINQPRDLKNVLLQTNEANRIIGQANIKAMTVLVDAVNQKQDTLPHEYAHHYIAWFRNTPIVQEAIKKWGTEEALVQSIGEQAVRQKGEAWNWWKAFTKWVQNLFDNLSNRSKQELTNILTDAFLTGVDLETGKVGISLERSRQLAQKASGIFNQEIKPGVEELFDSNPELASVGTPQQYSQYLDSIFPDSQVKDIVYHSRFTVDNIKNKDRWRNGFYSGTKEQADLMAEMAEDSNDLMTTSALLINMQNPKVTTYTDRKVEDYKNTNDGFIIEATEKDALQLIGDRDGYNTENFKKEYVVFEPEQVHILSSKPDIQGFKDYMASAPSAQPTQLALDLFREENSNMPDEDIDDYYNQCKI
jgi:hypothetical protein